MIRYENVSTAQDHNLDADSNVVHRAPGCEVTDNAREDACEEDTEDEARLEDRDDAGVVLWGGEVHRQGNEDLRSDVEHAEENSKRTEGDKTL